MLAWVAGANMQNFDLAKTLDTAIKAPLWIWFALMIASLIPMFNFSNLVETGVDSNFRLGPIPLSLSLAALAFTALFCSSATARSWGWLGPLISSTSDRWSFWLKLRLLPAPTRALLYVLEDDGKEWDCMEPDHPSVDPAKDAGILVAQLTGEDRAWSHIRYTVTYDRRLRRHRGHVRPALRVEKALRDEIRQSLARADRASHRLGR